MGGKTFSRALTSTTVAVSRAKRLSLVVLTTSCGVLGRGLKNENDIFGLFSLSSPAVRNQQSLFCQGKRGMSNVGVGTNIFLLRF